MWGTLGLALTWGMDSALLWDDLEGRSMLAMPNPEVAEPAESLADVGVDMGTRNETRPMADRSLVEIGYRGVLISPNPSDNVDERDERL